MKRIAFAAALLAITSTALGQSAGAPAAPSPLTVGQEVAGELSATDNQRRSGKFEDVFELQGRRGQRVDLRLNSEAFDAYLVVTGPEGFSLSNDDEDGAAEGVLHSRLVVELPADGRYRVSVTSFRAGESGRYRLSAATPAAGVEVTRVAPAQPIQLGAQLTGRLSARREETPRYRFTARRGERVRIDASSSDFDTILTLTRPDGTQDQNDDTAVDGETSLNSRIDTVLAEDGEYLIAVSAYAPEGRGDYRLSLARSPGSPRQANVQSGARVIALLVGVSDYDRTSDLANTDDDATELYASLRRAGMLHPASIALTNADATVANVRAAFRRIAAAAGPNDLFVFLFSGHGDQVDVPVSAAELDGRAETLELYDAALTDAQFAPLFAGVRARMSLLAVDACYAGGFRSMINRPNVIGMFSSEEDLTSLVASRFQAGGFLSYFLRAGISGEADDDGDRIITAGELSTYVRRRFRREGDVPATTREDERNYQNLLVERGGVHIDDVIVRLAGEAQLAPPPPPVVRPAVVSRPADAPSADEGVKPEDETDGDALDDDAPKAAEPGDDARR